MKLIKIPFFIFLYTLSNNIFSVGNLESAYKREHIFLLSELRELKKQEKFLNQKYKKAVKKAEKELETYQERIVGLNAYNEKISETLFKLEQSVEVSAENKTILENTLKQASLRFKVPKEEVQKVAFIFEKSLEKLSLSSVPSKRDGQFFLESGEEVGGEVLKIGEIASIGMYRGNYYNLAPAGNNKLKVWSKSNNGESLFSGKKLDLRSLFIYQGLDNNIQRPAEQSIKEFISAGGSIAWVIIMMGAVAMALCLLRFVSLFFYSKGNKAIEVSLNSPDEEKEEKVNSLSSRHTQKAFFQNIFFRQKKGQKIEDEIIDEGMLGEYKMIDRFGPMILVIAAIAPLMGLLGTVTGMISTFDIITEHGTGDPKMLSQGISEALITTELGLIVAIPTLLLGNTLSSWGKNLKMSLEKLVLKVVNEL